MAKIPFDIKYREQIENKEYRVVTRDGRTVRIICWDRKSETGNCIVVLVPNGTYEYSCFFKNTGRFLDSSISEVDLFIITPEPELTEFEKEICGVSNLNLNYSMKEEVRAAAAHILALAREEIAREDEFEISAV